MKRSKMSRLITFIMSAVMAFSVISGIAFTGSGFDSAITAEAAESYNKKMLPYYYEQLSDSEKAAYLKIRTAFINMKKSVDVNLNSKQADKLMNILTYCDVLTCFNGGGSHRYYGTSENSIKKIEFTYGHSKEDYQKILKFADSVSKKVIDKFTEDMTTYDKITYIHDYIASKCEYDLDARDANNIYGALSKKRAKCDGYSHAFNYICTKAGIKAVTVLGDTTKNTDSTIGHAWNKVYYNKKWYNVDVTNDDQDMNFKGIKLYNLFMVSDKTISSVDVEEDYGFKYPAATDDSKNYYEKHKLVAESRADLKKLLASQIAKSADKGKFVVCVQVKKGAELKDQDIFDVLKSANKKSKTNIITTGAITGPIDDCGVSLWMVQFFKKGTSISDYYVNMREVDSDTVSFLKSIGLKN